MAKKESLKIEGMSCAACALKIEKKLSKLPGVKEANVNFATEKATVEFDDQLLGKDQLEEAVKKLGYGILEEKTSGPTKAELNISGMTCAACSTKVERKLGKTEGVIKAAVNLATNKATVEYDPASLKASDLIKVVEDLGYGAKPVETVDQDREKVEREREIKRLRRELILSTILSAPLILAMLLSIFGIDIAFLHDWRFQLTLTTPVQFIIGFRFYRNSYYALRAKSPNMDVLVAMGTSAACLAESR